MISAELPQILKRGRTIVEQPDTLLAGGDCHFFSRGQNPSFRPRGGEDMQRQRVFVIEHCTRFTSAAERPKPSDLLVALIENLRVDHCSIIGIAAFAPVKQPVTEEEIRACVGSRANDNVVAIAAFVV